MKPQLRVGLVNFAAWLNCGLALIAICYGIYQLGDYIDKQMAIQKIEEEYKHDVTSNGRIIPIHAPGSLTANSGASPIHLTAPSTWIIGSGGGDDLRDGVELKTEEEKKVFNQWFYYTDPGKEYFSYLKKDEVPDAEGNYGRHLQVSVREYVWMMQWKFQKQNEKKD